MLSLKTKNTGIPRIIIGILISYATLLLCTFVITYLINNEIMSMDMLAITTWIVRFIAAGTGALYSSKNSIYKKSVSATIHGVLCIILMAITVIVLFEGKFQNVGLGSLSVIAGSFMPCVVGFHKKSGVRPIKYKARNG